MAQSLRHTTPLASSVSHRRLSVYSVVKEQHCRPLAPGGSVRFSRTAGHLIPESHERWRMAIECCRIDVDSTAKRQQSAVTLTQKPFWSLWEVWRNACNERREGMLTA